MAALITHRFEHDGTKYVCTYEPFYTVTTVGEPRHDEHFWTIHVAAHDIRGDDFGGKITEASRSSFEADVVARTALHVQPRELLAWTELERNRKAKADDERRGDPGLDQ